MKAVPRLALLAGLALALLARPAQAQSRCFTAEEAVRHIGERACVEGLVTAVVFARQSTGQPTFLDFGPQFTAVIWSEDRAKFDPPPETWRGRRARVTGRIDSYRGKAEIVVRDPAQLAVAGSATPVTTATAPPRTQVSAGATPAGTVISPSTATPLPAAPAVAPRLSATVDAATPPIGATQAPSQPVSSVLPVTVTSPAAVTPGERDGPSSALLVAGAALLAAGGGGGAWLALRGRGRP